MKPARLEQQDWTALEHTLWRVWRSGRALFRQKPKDGRQGKKEQRICASHPCHPPPIPFTWESFLHMSKGASGQACQQALCLLGVLPMSLLHPTTCENLDQRFNIELFVGRSDFFFFFYFLKKRKWCSYWVLGSSIPQNPEGRLLTSLSLFAKEVKVDTQFPRK